MYLFIFVKHINQQTREIINRIVNRQVLTSIYLKLIRTNYDWILLGKGCFFILSAGFLNFQKRNWLEYLKIWCQWSSVPPAWNNNLTMKHLTQPLDLSPEGLPLAYCPAAAATCLKLGSGLREGCVQDQAISLFKRFKFHGAFAVDSFSRISTVSTGKEQENTPSKSLGFDFLANCRRKVLGPSVIEHFWRNCILHLPRTQKIWKTSCAIATAGHGCTAMLVKRAYSSMSSRQTLCVVDQGHFRSKQQRARIQAAT